MQPGYIPWLGLFDLIDSVDKFVFLDDVKLQRNSWDVRNRIKTPQGELYLTIPVRRTKGRDKLMINKALINDSHRWRKKHLKTIEFVYKKAEFFNKVYPFLVKLINNNINKLSNFNINIAISIAEKLGINKEFIISSKLKNVTGKKDVRLVYICKEIGCDQYVSPQGAVEYIEAKSPGGEFIKNKIELFYQNYQHPVYKQLYGNFLAYMSIIDLLFNCGFIRSLKIIRDGRRIKKGY